VVSSKTTSRRLPELLRAFTAATRAQTSNARYHRILRIFPHSGAGHLEKEKRRRGDGVDEGRSSELYR
jgi:hypothetical protein